MKKRIFFDVDNTICNSTKRFVDLYNQIYNEQADWIKCYKWDYSDICPKINNSESIFAMGCFYNDDLDYMDKYIDTVIKMLYLCDWDVNFVTLGTKENLINKSNWLKHNFPYIPAENYHLLEKTEMGKAEIDMSDSILIDDNYINLLTSNADLKVCIHKPVEWNKDVERSGFIRLNNSLELYEFIRDLEKRGVFIE